METTTTPNLNDSSLFSLRTCMTNIDPRTVQPVGSRYTDYATRPTVYIFIYVNKGEGTVQLKIVTEDWVQLQ